MKIQKTEKLSIEYSNEVYINTYVSSWSGNVELKLNSYELGDHEHHLTLQLPLDKARALLKELTQDMENYDKEQADKAAEELSDVEE
jgi:hypothetical protein|tara:strand:+ start:112 stop:372 length:261 start_codon:yes stop_codon:yes gene_type:complete